MSDYDYLNARAKGISTGLLPPPFYERLLAAEGQEAALDLLHETAYGPQITESRSTGRGLAALESALGRHLFLAFAGLRALAPEKPRRLLSVQFSQWDAANVLAVLRGKLTAAEPGEILEALLPFGQAGPAQLEELAAQPGLEAVSDTLATWGYPFAAPLRQLIRGQSRKPDLIALESALNGAYFSWALSQAGSVDPQEALVRRMVRLQIDLANVKAGLDFVRHKTRGEAMEEVEPLRGGLLPSSLLRTLRQAASMVDAFEALGASYFAPGIERGILAFGASGSLGVMERFLEAVVIQQGCRLFRGDPLGVGVPLGLLWRKYSEYLNLRLLLRGKSFGMPAAAIREELLIHYA
jgi:vacuolar-type H+-ATPase subunit C/Vma6